MKRYDRYLARRCLLCALQRASGDRSLRTALLEWIHDCEEHLEPMDAAFLYRDFRKAGLELGDDDSIPGFGPRRRRRRAKAAPAASGEGKGTGAGKFLRGAIARLEDSLADPPPEGAEARATALAVRHFRLGGACGPVLDLARLYGERRSPLESLWDAVNLWLGDHLEATAALLGVSSASVDKALRRLSEVGIADQEYWSRNGAEPDDYRNDWFDRVYRPPVSTDEELRRRLVPLATEPLLGMDDFEHLDGRDDAVRLLAGAIESRRSVRLLFHGRAGTGKTEFSKTLVRAAGARLYDLGERESAAGWREESENRNFSRPARNRNRLRMAQALLRSEPDAVLLCDEIEDVLSSDGGSRRQNHRLLEEAAVPVIFTGNDLSGYDEALLRRFDLAIRFKVLNPARRRQVVRRMLENGGLPGFAAGDFGPLAARLSDELECPPGIIERAIHTTRLIKGSPEDLFRFADRHERTVSTQVARARLGPPVPANLGWNDFAHLGRQAEDIRQLLAAALAARRTGSAEARGVSFLAYGPPGGGKTEFCRTLAAEVGATLYSVGQKELGPDARRAASRKASFDYALEALADEPEAVILFDEFEDFSEGSKHWLNGVVETSPVPLLFTANSIGALRYGQPYFLDRLTHSLEFRWLPPQRRAAMFGKLLGAEGSPELETLAGKLAADRRVSPRQVRNAARVALLSGGGAAAARRAAEEKDLLRRGRRAAEPRAVEKYDFSLVHADRDLATLADQVAAMGHCRLGILLDGPPGSGKSEYAKQLARRMGLDPITKRASELMSKWVGETEQQIAEAFSEARATGAFLIFDEADSFLADRRGASRNWEISQVNEILSQLETHDLPYACTTNLADRLDPAAARRFLFRATFRYLDPPRVARAWEFFFGGEGPERALGLTRLVPADFALARERAEKLGFLDDPGRIAGELAIQSRHRESAGAIGF